MTRITRVVTRTGDKGQTGLASGQRVAKDSLRVEAYGTVDELNSQIGVALASGLTAELAELLGTIQNDLFHLGADLATPEDAKARRPGPQIEAGHVAGLEKWIEVKVAILGPLENFILPGGTAGAAALHMARTICRRAERIAVALSREENIGPYTTQYLNRLSDALFVMARLENLRRDVAETFWDSHA